MLCSKGQFHKAKIPSRYRILLTFFIMVCSNLTGYTTGQLDGSIPPCTEEGEEVYVPGISDDPCISCVCRNQQITCRKQQCANTEGCHMLLFAYEEIKCCQTCRGCYFEGNSYESGDKWTDASNPCRSYKCQAGVVTISNTECQVPCSNPVYIPGQCCPICQGCFANGYTYRNGQSFPSPQDICSTCTCQNGTVRCEKNACPVLNCVDQYIYTTPGSCCPLCRGTRQVLDLEKRACLFKSKVVTNDNGVEPDHCTNCTCRAGTMLCERRVSQPITCPSNYYVIYDHDLCGPKCERPRRSCKFKFQNYKDGSSWNPDDCTKCSCSDGVVRCQVHQCTNALTQCPQNTHLQHVPGECCPQCVDDDAVCTVFGDPHYRTFDGTIYNFQGLCNYILARDCSQEEDFSIHVRNDARLTNDFAWTKSVTIRLNRIKIYLFKNFRVKINRKRVAIPFEGFGVKVTGSPQTLTLRTSQGVKVIWDGDSYLEVSVPPKYKGRMCGLCGNYNNDEHDDLIGRDGNMYFNPKDFGETWRIGQKMFCVPENLGSHTDRKSACNTKEEKRSARKKCGVFKSGVLGVCAASVRTQPYYESCIADECDCPADKDCACEAVRAYVRECQRQGISLEWSPQLCQEQACEANARWSACAEPCPRTCQNKKARRTCNKLCQPGCECQRGYVSYENQCITSDQCPSDNRKKKKRRKNVDAGESSHGNLDLFLGYTRLSPPKDEYTQTNKRNRERGSRDREIKPKHQNKLSSPDKTKLKARDQDVLSRDGDRSSRIRNSKRNRRLPASRARDQSNIWSDTNSRLNVEKGRTRGRTLGDDVTHNSQKFVEAENGDKTISHQQRNGVALIKGRSMFDLLDTP